MDIPTFEKLVADARKQEDELLRQKGHDYTQGNADRLKNFKAIAARLNVTPMQVWAVYFFKHIDAIETFLRTGIIRSETIAGRFADARNYLYLGQALLMDTQNLDTVAPAVAQADGDCK